LAGITDQASIDDWDRPFPFDQSRVRPVDDDYWAEYRTTPKAFVTLNAGRQMWASRFGQVTNIRFERVDRQLDDAGMLSVRRTRTVRFDKAQVPRPSWNASRGPR
jgi:hypothetical protein